MAAFGDRRLGVAPTVTLHGRQFRYVGAEMAPVATTASAASLAGTNTAELVATISA